MNNTLNKKQVQQIAAIDANSSTDWSKHTSAELRPIFMQNKKAAKK